MEKCNAVEYLSKLFKRHQSVEIFSASSSDTEGKPDESDVESSASDKCEARTERIPLRFGWSMRKFSLMNELNHGLIEAQGADLRIITMDPTMCRILGYAPDGLGFPARPSRFPASVHDLLPHHLRDSHRRLLRQFASGGPVVPGSATLHPLVRGLPILRSDGSTALVDVAFGVVTRDVPLDSDHCVFYALVNEHDPERTPESCPHCTEGREAVALAAAKTKTKARAKAAKARMGLCGEGLFEVTEALYGHRAAVSIAQGKDLQPEEYKQVRARGLTAERGWALAGARRRSGVTGRVHASVCSALHSS
jgi:hypothetical protein